MKLKLALCAMAALAISGSVHAQDAVGDDSTAKFRSPSEGIILQQNLDKIELQKAGYYDKLRNGALGVGGGAGPGGLLGAGSSTIGNYYSVINQTTNNCSASGSAVGSSISCGSGSVTSNGNTQATVGSTLSSDTTTTGNTVTSKDNTTAGTITNNDNR